MKIGALLAALLLLFAAVSAPDCADAARMGGGKSFGSKPFMNNPTRQPPAMRQQATQQGPGAAAGATAARPGMLGGMGGIFGGLLAGTLLGSLLSGNGLGGGGGIMDILIFGILAFVGWKLFQRFRSRPQQETQPAGAPGGMFRQEPPEPMQSPMQQTNAEGGMWDKLKNMAQGTAPQTLDANIDVPAGFDAEEFLRGAKMAYSRMQQSWDKRDLDDISQFATPTVMRELKEQAAEDPNPSRTEIMQVNAQVVGAENEGDNMRAQVYFDVLMREDPRQQTPSNVREIWHFLRIGQNGNWKLDGIQQVD